MNKITLSGMVASVPELSHEILGEKFYKFYLISRRTSRAEDELPCLVSEILMKGIEADKKIKITGEIRTRNTNGHLKISVFAQEVFPYDGQDKNIVDLRGFICKEPKYRITPLGRQITDFLVANNRKYGKSDYIPCITWGRNAVKVSDMPVGTELHIIGRLQSRKYQKQLPNGMRNTRTAYELSADRIEVMEGMEEFVNERNYTILQGI